MKLASWDLFFEDERLRHNHGMTIRYASSPVLHLQVKEYQKHLAGIALRGNNTCFDELLPAAAQANLAKVKEMTWVQSAMANGKEVAANLDQDPAVMEHVGVLMPVILASISHMWATRANRPFLPQE